MRIDRGRMREVLAFAASGGRVLLTQNRLHFLRLHRGGAVKHAGIMICTFDPDFGRLAERIHEQVSRATEMSGSLFRVTRPGS